MAVSSAATATPARTIEAMPPPMPGDWPPRPAPDPSPYVIVTAPTAPANAAGGNRPGLRPPTMISVAPRPAPAATPSREGAARGVRKTPWDAAPPPASRAPASAPGIPRGNLVGHTIGVSVGGTGGAGG